MRVAFFEALFLALFAGDFLDDFVEPAEGLFLAADFFFADFLLDF